MTICSPAVGGHLLWTVFVDRADENLWRATLGQADLDAWCAAHGWDSMRVLSGSVNVYAYPDGHVEVLADLSVLDDDGQPRWDEDAKEPLRQNVAARLARSLPEGIGTVIR